MRFNSRWYCPGCEAIDAFSQNWRGSVNWLVPPPSLLVETFKKIVLDMATGILVFTFWRSHEFWTHFLEIRRSKNFLIDIYVLPKHGVVVPGRGKNGVFGNNDISFNLIAMFFKFKVTGQHSV